MPGLLLLGLTLLFLIAFINVLLTDPQIQFQAMLAGLMLAFLWYLYMHLPHFLRRFISKLFRRSRPDNHEH